MSYAEIIEDVIKIAEKNERLQRREGDYMQDGLLYCGRCRTPKTARIVVQGNVLFPRCLCECETIALRAEEAEQRKRERAERKRLIRRAAFDEQGFTKCTFETDDCANERISAIAKRYADKFSEIRSLPDNNGLLFYGGVGTGKSFIAACVANAIIDQGFSCRMTTLSHIVNEIGGTFDGKQELLDEYNAADLLILDDFGAERETEYMNEIVFNVIDARAASKKPLIITTNLSGEDLKNPSGINKRRIYSRVLERCTPVEVSGEDRRRAKLKANYKGMADILGI